MSVTLPEAIPLMRGRFHLYAFFGALLAGGALVVSADTAPARASAWIYVGALAATFGASALYHRYPWRKPGHRAWARRLDHSMIFVLIAGTYTPFAWLAFNGPVQAIVLICVWAGVLAGLALNLVWVDAPTWLHACAYVLVGWVGVLAIPEFIDSAGVTLFVLAIAGGIVYTLGAVVYASHRPNPFPSIVGFHEVFHLLTIVAAGLHFAAVALLVA